MENSSIRRIDLADWIQSGEGSTALTYNHKEDDRIMLKVVSPNAFAGGGSAEESFNLCQNELEKTKQLLAMGFSVPDAIEVVDVNGIAGIIYERIGDKKSFARVIADEPDRLPEMAKRLAAETKKLHLTSCNINYFPDMRKKLLKILDGADFLEAADRKEAKRRLKDLPDARNCIHGDLTLGNILLAGDKIYWIDLGDFSYGSSWLDLGTLYFLTKYHDEYKEALFHLNSDTLAIFWDWFLPEYLGTKEAKYIQKAEETAKKYAFVFLLKTCEEGHTRQVPLDVIAKIISELLK